MKHKRVPHSPKEFLFILYTLSVFVTLLLVKESGHFSKPMLEYIINAILAWSFGLLLLPLI
jgi:hypothetical protein